MTDLRTLPSVTITDIYTRDGQHQKSVCLTPDGEIIWEEGRTPSKDVVFFPSWKYESLWP